MGRPLIFMAAAIILTMVAAPAGRALPRGVRLMLPEADETATATSRHVMRSLRARPEILAAPGACAELQQGRSVDFSEARRIDPGNGLYAWLELLLELRRADQASTSGPAPSQPVADALARAMSAPPARLYQARAFEVVSRAVCMFDGLSPGVPHVRADGWALRMTGRGGGHRLAIRELGRRLCEQGARRGAAGRTAYAAAVRLYADLIEDSPAPDVVFLAAEFLPQALRGLAASMPPERLHGTRPDALADCWGMLTTRWREEVKARGANTVPWTGDITIATRAEDRLLRSMAAAALAAMAWAVLAAACIVLLPFAAHRVRVEPTVAARGQPWAAIVIAASPALLTVLCALFLPISPKWVLSFPTFRPTAFFPFVCLGALAVATRLAVREVDAKSALPRAAARILVIVPLALAVAALLVLPIPAKPWHPSIAAQIFRGSGSGVVPGALPPISVQVLRTAGTWFGIGTLLSVGVWAVWGFVRRRRRGVPMGARARGALGVASAALLATTLTATVALAWNGACLKAHATAFARAAADPVSDVLGPDWRQDYVSELRRLADLPGQHARPLACP